MNKIKLTRGQVALVDDKDFKWLNQYKWYAKKVDGRYNYGYYAVRNITQNGRKRHQYMHKLILGIDGTDIIGDHKDGNKLNNMRDNLRIATPADNSHNRKCGKNTSGFKGVTWNKRSKKFISQIRFKEKVLYLGSFDDAVLAAKVYDTKAIELFGEFANINLKEAGAE